MQYCTNCVLPETRPGVNFDEKGVCNFCRYQKSLSGIDWLAREKEGLAIAEEVKKKRAMYDCVVGASGGKDSMVQALYARDELGLKVLLVNVVPDTITKIGRQNMDNMQKMGFDCLMVKPNPKICRRLAKMAFYKWGNPVKPSEYILYAAPVRTAILYKIPLVVFDIDNTYRDDVKKGGAGADASRINNMNTLGYSGDASHLVCEGVTLDDLQMYQFPTQEEIINAGVKMVYYAYFKGWNSHAHGMYAINRGLRIRTDDLHELGRYTRYHNLDDDTQIVNQMLKYIKLGYGFATEEAYSDIGLGRIIREEGVKLVNEYDGKCGVKYIKAFCDYIGITLDEFWNVVEKFRGPMWTKNSLGGWILKEPVS